MIKVRRLSVKKSVPIKSREDLIYWLYLKIGRDKKQFFQLGLFSIDTHDSEIRMSREVALKLEKWLILLWNGLKLLKPYTCAFLVEMPFKYQTMRELKCFDKAFINSLGFCFFNLELSNFTARICFTVDLFPVFLLSLPFTTGITLGSIQSMKSFKPSLKSTKYQEYSLEWKKM